MATTIQAVGDEVKRKAQRELAEVEAELSPLQKRKQELLEQIALVDKVGGKNGNC